METTIFIVSHQILNKAFPEGYKIMYVGEAGNLKTLSDAYTNDRQSTDSIYHKNKYYCELTALHQIAKFSETTPNTIFGLVHYRRFFLHSKNIPWRALEFFAKKTKLNKQLNFIQEKFFLNKNIIESLVLDDNTVIAPKKVEFFRKTVKQQYEKVHYKEDLIILRNVLLKLDPKSVPFYDDYMDSNHSHLFNMMIAKGALILKYTNWLFPILKELEDQISYQNRSQYQSRVFGFISERLFNVFLRKNNIEALELNTSFHM
jgi:hypothetical protein